MTDPKRLFDCIEWHLERKPLEVMLAGKEGGQWKTYSTKEVSAIANNLSAGLLSLGIGPHDMTVEGRDKIAILARTVPNG
jgi:long-chain acyl-CoA synthetase